MEPWMIIGAVLLLILIWVIAIFNRLVRARNMANESWSAIDTELKRRYDLIPNLVATVKGYASHEKGLFESIAASRNRAVASTGSPATQAKDENALVGNLRQLFAVVEKYPDLKADQNFLKLQLELANTEDRIQASRRFYNANVRDLDTQIQVFPSNLIAGMFGFQLKEFFEIESAVERQNPQVQLGI